MSEKASPTTIGAFVLGAIALIVTGLLTFGSGQFFKDTHSYVLYFEGNAKGLNVGAPASFRGVKIGTVTKVELVANRSTAEIFISVVVETDPDAFREVDSKTGVNREASDIPVRKLIEEHGLRAKLATLSLVTGQLYIEFDFYPDTPARLTGFASPYEEIPTLPSAMEELEGTLQTVVKSLREAPLREVVNQMAAAVKGINSLIDSPALKDTLTVLRETLQNLRELTAKLDAQVTPLADSLRETSEQAAEAFADVRKLLQDDTGKVVRLAESIEGAANQARDVLSQTQTVVSAVDGKDLETLVEELSGAARSIRVLADYLERHPEALIRGKN
jgi:paraquat-inducible protein B